MKPRRWLSRAELADTVASIEAVQLKGGMIPWFEGGHCDPWNHVEAAMALSAGGRIAAAEQAYQWLRSTQRADGSWHNYYNSDGSVEDGRRDSNVCAYVATGTWHHHLATSDLAFVKEMWPTVENAMGFALSLQRESGELVWSLDEEGIPERYALLTGSSSTYFSLRCAIACAELVGAERPEWELAAGRLRHAIHSRPELFAPKERWAMDWYYPVLVGALPPATAAERLDEGWPKFVMEGLGVRCVADQPWVTTAETAECALACLALGRADQASRLLDWAADQRDLGGTYTTGRVYPGRATFPDEERTTYSAAAIVLADDMLAGESAASQLFSGRGLPAGLDLDELDEVGAWPLGPSA
ncbi:MAG: prenyltransferase [Acidimicrobiales bacterium]